MNLLNNDQLMTYRWWYSTISHPWEKKHYNDDLIYILSCFIIIQCISFTSGDYEFALQSKRNTLFSESQRRTHFWWLPYLIEQGFVISQVYITAIALLFSPFPLFCIICMAYLLFLQCLYNIHPCYSPSKFLLTFDRIWGNLLKSAIASYPVNKTKKLASWCYNFDKHNNAIINMCSTFFTYLSMIKNYVLAPNFFYLKIANMISRYGAKIQIRPYVNKDIHHISFGRSDKETLLQNFEYHPQSIPLLISPSLLPTTTTIPYTLLTLYKLCHRRLPKLFNRPRLTHTFLILFLHGLCCPSTAQNQPHIDPNSYDRHNINYTNTFVVLFRDSVPIDHDMAKQFIENHGFSHVHTLDEGHHVMVHQGIKKRSAIPFDIHNTFNFSCLTSPDVIYIEQQKAKNRVKRDINYNFPEERNQYVNFNDPRYPQQWYLHRGRGLDLNTIEAWSMGYTGKGVVISILDDGIEKDNPDLINNYDPEASYDINDQDSDPQPRYDLTNENRHGTRCAGEVAAVANNSICIVGVAFRSRIGGVRMLDGDVTDAVEAQALSLNPDHIDIYSASWGPDDDGKTLDGPATLAQRAFENGVKMGRRGLGSIFAWASGNGGRDRDNCNCDGYTNSIYTLSISSATESGYVPWYSEACSSTLATTYSSGSVMENKIISTDLRGGCTDSHTGTSASAPLAAGIIALALEANPNLNWRDMQHLVIRTSRPDHLHADDWVTNGVGRKVSHSFGYGMMDAGAMVRTARTWRSVPPANICTVSNPRQSGPISPNGSIRFTIETDGCLGLSGYNNYMSTRYGDSDYGGSKGGHVKYLEHVQARITLKAPERGKIEIYLTSPAGTKSKLLFKRPKDFSGAGVNDWPFMTTHNWGELSYGTWSLEITNGAALPGYLVEWSLNMYGTETQPESFGVTSGARGLNENFVIKQAALSTESSLLNCFKMLYPGHCLVCEDAYALYEGMCLRECPPNLYKALIMAPISFASNHGETETSASIPNNTIMVKKIFSLVCKSCHAICKRCKGGGPGDCGSCHDGYYLVPAAPHRMAQSLAVSWTTTTFVSCKPCHVTCGTCSGPGRSQCTSCHRQTSISSLPRLVKGRCLQPNHAHVRSEKNEGVGINDGQGSSSMSPSSFPYLIKYRLLVLSVLGMVLISFFMALFLVTKNINDRNRRRNTKKLHVIENFINESEENSCVNDDSNLKPNSQNNMGNQLNLNEAYDINPQLSICNNISQYIRRLLEGKTRYMINDSSKGIRTPLKGTVNESFKLTYKQSSLDPHYKLVPTSSSNYNSFVVEEENDSEDNLDSTNNEYQLSELKKKNGEDKQYETHHLLSNIK